MTPFKYNMTLKEYNRRRAILKALLQVYVDHRTIVEGGLSLVDVSTSLSWSRAQTEALVETLVSEGYLYSTHDTDHYQITCDEMPSDEELSSLVASQGPQQSAPSATAPSRQQQPAPPLRRELTQASFPGWPSRPSGDPRAAVRTWFDANAAWPSDSSDDDARPPAFGGRRTFETLATKAPPVACARFTKLPARIVRTLSMASRSGRHDAHARLRSVGGGS